MKFWLAVIITLWGASSASAQRRTTNGFETDCAGGNISGLLSSLTGYVDKDSSYFASCGISSIVTGEVAGKMRIGTAALLTSVPNVTGSNALVGAHDSNNPSNLTLEFSPPVNELSLQVLGISNNGNLHIETYDANNAQLSSETGPAPSGGRIMWARNSAVAMKRLFLSYPQSGGIFSGTTAWYVDQLSFNAWVCGDGEIDNTNGGSEICDDGNAAQCDGCTSSCTASTIGCFNGSACVAPNTSNGCATCDMTKPAGPTGDVLTSAAPMGTACDDALKCSLNDACDGSGRCVGTVRSCDDAISCTNDSCSEAAAGDGCVHTLGAHLCLIGATCVPELGVNPTNACQLCDPVRAANAWSPQANTVRCGSPSCVGDQFTPAALCDGTGNCAPVAPTSCSGFACATSTSCTDSCSNDRECGTASHCDKTTMKCVDNLVLGAPCTSGAQCANGLACADGVCCESACGSKCETCNAPGFVGKCVNITFGDPENECPDGSSCRSGNQCVPDPPPMMPTQPMQDAGTMPGNTVLPIGAACDRNEACGLGVCKDGVCCESACDGPCQGCNVLGASPGQCMPYSLGSDPENECEGVGGVCSGENACTYYQTRGNGLCSATPASRSGSPLALLALASLASLLVWRRRR
jgi:MYXO-CTERM domain-containing protein